MKSLEWEVVYVWDEDQQSAEYSEMEIIKPDVVYDVSIYDCDEDAACIQFAQGEIVIAVPTTAFTVEERCHSCDDPDDPDLDRVGPLGGVPRYSPARFALEAEQLRLEALEWLPQREDDG